MAKRQNTLGTHMYIACVSCYQVKANDKIDARFNL